MRDVYTRIESLGIIHSDPDDLGYTFGTLNMDIKIKQRLVGALVLVGFVSIILPIIFHGSSIKNQNVTLSPVGAKAPAKPHVTTLVAKQQQIVTLERRYIERTQTNRLPRVQSEQAQIIPKPNSIFSDESARLSQQRAEQRAIWTSSSVSKKAKASKATRSAASSRHAKSKKSVKTSVHRHPHRSHHRSKHRVHHRLKHRAHHRSAHKKTARTRTKIKTRSKIAKTKTKIKTTIKRKPKHKTVKKTTAWTIQVASFRAGRSAWLLEQRLRKKGYRAYIQRMATHKGKIYRVLVGPAAKKLAAQKLLLKLSKKEKLKGIVVSWSPV